MNTIRNIFDMIFQHAVVNSMSNNIIEIIYTHSLQGFSVYNKQNILVISGELYHYKLLYLG